MFACLWLVYFGGVHSINWISIFGLMKYFILTFLRFRSKKRESGAGKDTGLSFVGAGKLWRFGVGYITLNSWVPTVCSLNLSFWEFPSFTGYFPYNLGDGIAKISIRYLLLFFFKWILDTVSEWFFWVILSKSETPKPGWLFQYHIASEKCGEEKYKRLILTINK